ncbi:tricarballylate utilization 4Fe-4S protein TcuB [Thioalkalicoccus limnaeus]|uniref:Tricarballylate utilization 4Fe-4S protein TcuB n=1 Tax=Thioalkalicoccus limnaeus TaxID=120681 RepID=A0ABV4BG38_9GAMM
MSAPATEPREDSLAEGRRTLALCDVCGFCTGFCPVFRATGERPALTTTDIAYLANLCHNCRACWYACQYAPPHPFAINVPATLARVRFQTYRDHVWPRAFAPLMTHSAAATLVVALLASLLVPLTTLLAVPPERLFASHRVAGAFYEVIPWGLMSALAGLSLGWALLALAIGGLRFWRDTAPTPPRPISLQAWPTASRDLLTLRHLDGGGGGCNDHDDRFTQRRRLFHLALLHGFLLCVAATLTAALYHHLFDWPAPYPVLSAPVLLGTLGGLGLLVGVIGLLLVKLGADPEPTAAETLPADYALLGLIGAVAVSGLILLVLRETPAMGLLLAWHLGTVLAFFLMMPYGKFVHGLYRALALLRHAAEARSSSRTTPTDRS